MSTFDPTAVEPRWLDGTDVLQITSEDERELHTLLGTSVAMHHDDIDHCTGACVRDAECQYIYGILNEHHNSFHIGVTGASQSSLVHRYDCHIGRVDGLFYIPITNGSYAVVYSTKTVIIAKFVLSLHLGFRRTMLVRLCYGLFPQLWYAGNVLDLRCEIPELTGELHTIDMRSILLRHLKFLARAPMKVLIGFYKTFGGRTSDFINTALWVEDCARSNVKAPPDDTKVLLLLGNSLLWFYDWVSSTVSCTLKLLSNDLNIQRDRPWHSAVHQFHCSAEDSRQEQQLKSQRRLAQEHWLAYDEVDSTVLVGKACEISYAWQGRWPTDLQEVAAYSGDSLRQEVVQDIAHMGKRTRSNSSEDEL